MDSLIPPQVTAILSTDSTANLGSNMDFCTSAAVNARLYNLTSSIIPLIQSRLSAVPPIVRVLVITGIGAVFAAKSSFTTPLM